MKRYLLIGAAVGLAIPFAFWTAYFLSGYRYMFGNETFALWPSSILLLATDGHEGSPASIAIAGVSVFLNVVLYSLVGILVYGIASLIRRVRGDA